MIALHNKLLQAFITYLLTRKLVARNTCAAYKSDIEQLLLFLESGSSTIENTSEQRLKEYCAHLRINHIGARSSARKLCAIKLFYRYLEEHHNLQNPARDLIIPRIEKLLPRFLNNDHVDQLLAAARAQTDTLIGRRNQLIIYLMYVTGMRVSELCALTTTSIRSSEGLIAVSGKGDKERLIPVPAPVMKLLREYIEHDHIQWLKNNKSTYVFPVLYASTIKPISRQMVWMILQQLWALTGNKMRISPHMLRHSFATHMLAQGAHTRALQTLLGHEHLDTVQIYTHVETTQARTIYDKKHPRS